MKLEFKRKRFSLLLATGLLSAILLSGEVFYLKSRHAKIEKPPEAIYSQKTASLNSLFPKTSLEYFAEIAIGGEYGGDEKTITKWEKPRVGIKENGSITPPSTNCLVKVISDFNKLSSEVKLQKSFANSDINLHYAPESKFKSIEFNYVPKNHGFFWILWDSRGRIYKGTVLINSTNEVTEKERCHLIREEITQSMGLRNDSDKFPDSIFYKGWTSTNSYSKIDEDVIKIIYSSSVKAGDSYKDILN